MGDVDVIVIGAGSAGAVVAARLAEDPSCQVLLLESGPDYCSAQTPPEIHDLSPLGTLTDPVLAAAHLQPGLLAARSAAQPERTYRQGRGAGGSSSINGLFAVRPLVEDLDTWAAQGCDGWSFDDVLPLLNRLESDLDFGAEPHHGDSGPIPIRRPPVELFQPLEAAFREAAVALGHGWAPDHNAPHATGVSPYAFNGHAGRRCSTNDAYLEPARARRNLTIRGGAVVTDVLVEGSRAVGVRVRRGAQTVEHRAAQVVVCAGALLTPAILLRSGIGPAEHLRELGIEVRANLPVGLGLQDHPAITVLAQLHDGTEVAPADRRHSRCCLRLSSGLTQDRDDLFVAALNPAGVGPVGQLVGWVNRVRSRGRVRLRSADPAQRPRVDVDLLSDPADMAAMRRLLREMQDLMSQSALQAVTRSAALVQDVETDECVALDTRFSDSELDRFLLVSVGDVSHVTSTCRMGRSDDPDTVVDATGRVHGVEGLRVADASVLPSVPRANTHLSAVLVGEKVAADLIGARR